MNKENILFSLVGVLLGFIVGFIFANTANRAGAPAQAAVAAAPGQQPGQQNAPLPPGHPPIQNSATQPGVDMNAVRESAKLADDKADNFDAQVAAARLASQAERYDDAAKYFGRANKLRPDDHDTLVALGNTYFDAGKFADAERWYAAALAKKPDEVNVRTDYGLTFMLREPAQLDRAIAEFKRSLEVDPQHPQTLQNLAIAYTRKGDAAQARAAIARLEAVSPNNESLAQLRSKVDERSSSSAAKTPAETSSAKPANNK